MATVSTASRLTAARPARTGGRLPGAASKAPLLMFLAAGALLPWAVGDYWTFNVTVGLILAVSCLGLQVLTGWAKQISLMQAGLTGAATNLDGYLFGDCGWGCNTAGVRHHFLFSAAVTIAFTVAVSVAVALLGARRPLVYPIVASFAVQFLIDEVSRPKPTPLMTGLPSPARTPRQFLHLSLESDRGYYLYVFAVLLVVLAGVHRLRRSRFGRAMIAVGNDPVSASVQGISPNRARVGAFAVAGLLAGVAGVLNAPLYRLAMNGRPWESPQSLVYLAVAVVAGRRSGLALVVVAVTTTVLPTVCRHEFGVQIPVELIAGTAMLVMLLAQPLGLGRLTAGLRRNRARARRVPLLEAPIPAARSGWLGLSRRATGLVALSVALVVLGLSVAVRHDHESLPVGVSEYELSGNVRLSAITAGPDGNMWFTEIGRIGRITPTGRVTEFRGDVSPPEHRRTNNNIIAAGGSLWFTDDAFGLGQISTQGTVTLRRGAGAITTGPGGDVWITNGAGIARITPARFVTDYRIPGPHILTSTITAGPDGNLWFTAQGNNRIWRITPAGQITSYAGLPTYLRPGRLTPGPDGNLWFTAYPDYRIWRITPAGRITSYPGLPAPTPPRQFAAGSDGNLWFTAQGDNRIWRITPAGRLTSFGGLPPDAGPDGFGGWYPNPRVLTAGPDGDLWVVTDKHDLARITPTGVITGYHIPGPDLRSLAAGPDGTLWFTAENDGGYYPGRGAIGRITVARLGGGHILPSAPATN